MIIGLTGGIGSGKSTVCKLFQVIGYTIYNSDERAKAIYFLPSIKKQVIHLLGETAYIDNTSINKRFIADKIHHSIELRQALNAIIHPAVSIDFTDFIELQPKNSLIIKETALLFEANLQRHVDTIILVTAPLELRLKRVMQRDLITKEDVVKRINNQLDDELKKEKSNYIIYNDEAQSLIQQVLQIDNQLRAMNDLSS